MQQDILEEALAGLPVLQWSYLKTKDVSFLDRVRTICEQECPRYGTSWSCPPAVGTVQECRKRCEKFEHVFVFSSIAEVEDITDMQAMLDTRMEHECLTKQVTELFQQDGSETLTLSTESCELCANCTYPAAACRHPDRMYPCVESYGILVTELAELGGMEFMNGSNVVTWFSAIFY